MVASSNDNIQSKESQRTIHGLTVNQNGSSVENPTRTSSTVGEESHVDCEDPSSNPMMEHTSTELQQETSTTLAATTTTTTPTLLPELTPQLLQEYQAEKEAAARRTQEGWNHGEAPTICGVPYYLFMTLTALAAAVTAGTVLAVIFYDPSELVQPPEYPSAAPTESFLPTNNDGE